MKKSEDYFNKGLIGLLDLVDDINKIYNQNLDEETVFFFGYYTKYVLDYLHCDPKKCLDWDSISSEKNYLSEEFIYINSNYLNWDLISEYQNLSENFIEMFMDKVNLFNIFKYQNVSEEFIYRHRDIINENNYYWILKRKLVSLNFIENNFSYLLSIMATSTILNNFKRTRLYKYKELPVVIRLEDIFKVVKFSEKFLIDNEETLIPNSYSVWRYIFLYQDLSVDYLSNHVCKINYTNSWDVISVYQKLDEDFVSRYIDKFDRKLLEANQKFTEVFYNINF